MFNLYYYFSHPGLKRPILFPFRRLEEMSVTAIVDYIEAVLESEDDFDLDEQMVIKFTLIQNPNYGGGT